MRKLLLFLLVNFIFTCVNGQNSNLYNSERKLFADTTLKIDTRAMKFVEKFENEILSDFYNSLSYPEIASENGIEGLIVVKVKIDNKTKELTTFLEKKGDPKLFEEVSRNILKLKQRLLLISNESVIYFYLPVLFSLEKNNFKKDLIEKKLIIKKTIAPSEQFVR